MVCAYICKLYFISSHLSPLTSEVVGAPRMTLQQYLSTLPCLPLPSGNLETPFPSIPWCYLPISSSVFLSFLLLSLSPAELSSPCPRILRCGHTIWVSVSLPLLGDHHALHLCLNSKPGARLWIRMPSPILWFRLLKMKRIVLLNSILRFSPITVLYGEWL